MSRLDVFLIQIGTAAAVTTLIWVAFLIAHWGMTL
jgi:hypothetical protein